MKKCLMFFIAVAATSTALAASLNSSATCFHFVNGKGPSRLGNTSLSATATDLCMDSGSFHLYDSQS